MLNKLRLYVSEFWHTLTQDWAVMRETPIIAGELEASLALMSLPCLNFYLLLTLASMIATFGLLTNSAATIIGAMIVAPLMNPIIALAYSLVKFQGKLIERSLFTLSTGVFLVILIGYFTTELLGLKVVGSEILGRIQPNSLDLGVALAAGAAAAFANTRKSIANALPGVAIAVALVPPLSVVGIGLCLGELGDKLAGYQSIATGSFLLFMTNLAGIIFSASLIFLLQNYGNFKQAMVSLIGFLLLLVILMVPLGFSFDKLYVESVANHTLFQLRQENPELFSRNSKIETFQIWFGEDRKLHLDIELELPVSEKENMQKIMELATLRMSEALGRPIEVTVNAIFFETFTN